MQELETLRRIAPEYHAALLEARGAAAAAVDPAVLDPVRRRLEGMLDLADEGPALDAPWGPLVEQSIVYVADVTEVHVAPAREALGEKGLRALLDGLYVEDMTCRLRLTHSALFGHELGGPAGLAEPNAVPIDDAHGELHASAMRLQAVDPVTTELVRLRCARYHDCGT